MSSYGHNTTSSSFPADYGLLAAARSSRTGVVDEDSHVTSDSSRTNYTRPSNPSMASVKRKSSDISTSHERTPLLSSVVAVPRIHEEVQELRNGSEKSAVYFEELLILSKYTLPVFG